MLYEILEKSAEEIAKNIGKHAAIGGTIDGVLSVVDKKNIVKEVGCGAVTSGSGAAAREAVEYFSGSNNWSRVAGIVASVGARYAYRRACGDIAESGDDDEDNSEHNTMEYIKKAVSSE